MTDPRAEKPNQSFPSLETITSPTVDTATAAYFLNRKEKTLRVWACTTGPIKPIRIHGRLGWPVADLRALLKGGAA